MSAEAFDRLCRRVSRCRRCPRMADSARVLSTACGPVTARLMFIGEAPGRYGADRTGVPFHGDVSGNNFESFLAAAGLTRDQVFITNAALCNPKDAAGNNATPTKAELAECARHLKAQISLINPPVIATLGAVALRALNTIEAHELALKTAVRARHAWWGRQLVPLYHPGARALIHRNRRQQRADYRFLAKTLAAT